MKSLQQIKHLAQKGDYTQVASMCGTSPDLVKKVINSLRTDHHGIQKAFSDMLETRERITSKMETRRERKQKIAA